MTSISTKLVNIGNKYHKNNGFPSVNPPIYRASTIVFDKYEDLLQAEAQKGDLPSYGRYGNPTIYALEESLAELEGAKKSWVTSSGLGAINIVLTSFLSAGDHLLMIDSVYGCTKRYCNSELSRFNIEVEYYAANTNIEPLIKENTKIIYIESPASLTFEVQDIEKIIKIAHANNIMVVADNTWATPLYFKPFDWGIDISIHAATKYIGGHSDLLMGVISARNDEYIAKIKRIERNIGACTTGDNAYLALRGLRTMEVRMKAQMESALKIAKWLDDREEVAEILFPAYEGSKTHKLWKKYMSGGASLFAIKLSFTPTKQQLSAMLDEMQYFAMGFSWGGYESLTLPVFPAKIRDCDDRWNKSDVLLRFHIGLEDTDDLIADIKAGFSRLKG